MPNRDNRRAIAVVVMTVSLASWAANTRSDEPAIVIEKLADGVYAALEPRSRQSTPSFPATVRFSAGNASYAAWPVSWTR